MCVYVCVCMRACVRACLPVCMRACACGSVPLGIDYILQIHTIAIETASYINQKPWSLQKVHKHLTGAMFVIPTDTIPVKSGTLGQHDI